MENRLLPVSVRTLAVVVLMFLCGGRTYMGLGDFSYFFVAGSDFVNASQTPAPVFVQNGQGYDGQFFYRLALDPFDFSKTSHGVTIDHPPYRVQRIGYPVLTWIFSGGGIPSLVPIALFVVNAAAFCGILFFCGLFAKRFQEQSWITYAPLFLCGLYMSLARDLSEVTELCFFLGALYALSYDRLFLFAAYGSMAVLCRETSLIAIVPVAIGASVQQFRNRNLTPRFLFLFVPWIVFASWKAYVLSRIGTTGMVAATGNLGIPFAGMLAGFRGNLDVSTAKNVLQLFFWICYFMWQAVFCAIVLRAATTKSAHVSGGFRQLLTIAWISWGVFAVCLSPAIYIDDWSFVRVFSLWNMTGFLLLAVSGRSFPRLFTGSTLLLAALTLIRMVLRP